MENLITTIISGNIGTVILVLVLWKSGVLKFLLNGKKDQDNHNGQMKVTLQDVIDSMDKLEQHYNNDTTTLLQEIKDELRDQNQKLDKIVEGIIYIRARCKNGNG